MQAATLRLFNAVQVDNKNDLDIPISVHERTSKNGYVLDRSVRPDDRLLDIIENIVGISGEKANAAFHKSWSIIQDSSVEALFTQQIVHYFTTYGFEQLGIYQQSAVYVPCEVLDLPAIKEHIPFIIIKGLTAQEILEKIINLGSGIALAQETLDDVMIIVKANNYDSAFVSQIKNRELIALLFDHYGIVPSEPVEFLRHLISKLTDESLIIKNDYLIEKIKKANGNFLEVLLKDAPGNLASIFFRYKPLFLAMKTISSNKTFFNQLRKRADALHAPMPEDYLNNITSQIQNGKLDLDGFAQRIEKASIFRKIRLAYALKHRVRPKGSIVYRIRNGRGWATEFQWPDNLEEITLKALDIVLASIAADMRKNVSGKIFYVPANVHYALPATEKQFIGHLPNGTYVSVPEDLIVGIHWKNTKRCRVDLDLSVIGESGKIGWDAAYRSDDRSVLFSGDVTDAPPPHGASELFYIRKGTGEPRILSVNYFNFQDNDEVECKVLAAHERPKNFGCNYLVDVNNIIASANMKISKKQTILGLIINVDGENRVYFANVSVGNSITSVSNGPATHARKYLVERTVNSLDLKEMLRMAGAKVVDKVPDGEYRDLSPEALDKSIIIEMLNPQ